ncbi:MAG: lipid A-modifier LpxR family protein, partial [Bacteroidota bacterium]
MKKSVLIILFFLPIFLFSQRIDNLVSFRDVQTDNYFRFSYDNDLFSLLDQDYTQGINFELVSLDFKKNPINFLFIKTKNSNKKYGLSLEHNCFTPKNIQSEFIQFDDRPFAATLVLKNFMISIDTFKRVRISSFMNFGLIGPLAFGNEMQTSIHQITKNPLPGGWKNQIRNDFVISYGLSHEKQLFRYRNLFSVQSYDLLKPQFFHS